MAGSPTGCRCGAIALFALAAACAVAIVLGSFDHGTTRVYDGGAPNRGTASEEGADRWAVWAFLCGLLALGAIGLAAWATVAGHHGLGAILALPATPPFALAALVAARHLQRLLAERDRERNYPLTIAAGLPIVTLAAAAGTFLALLLAPVLLGGRR